MRPFLIAMAMLGFHAFGQTPDVQTQSIEWDPVVQSQLFDLMKDEPVVLIEALGKCQTYLGIASYYDTGRVTANGERFNPHALTAAHRTLPFNTRAHVTNLANQHSVDVRINDRGPFIKGRIIDLTPVGARAIGMGGLANVSLRVCL